MLTPAKIIGALLFVSVVASPVQALWFLAGSGRQCPTNTLGPLECHWVDPNFAIWDNGGYPPPVSVVFIASQFATTLIVGQLVPGVGSYQPLAVTIGDLYVGGFALTLANEKKTLRVIAGSSLTCENLFIRQSTTVAQLTTEVVVENQGSVTVNAALTLNAKLTISGSVAVGQLVPENETNAYGLPELVLNAGSGMVFFGAQDWTRTFIVTNRGNMQFFSLGPSHLAKLGASTINCPNGALTFSFGATLALEPTASIVLTGATSQVSHDSMSSIVPYLAGKLNNTGGAVTFDGALDINATGSYWQQGGRFVVGGGLNLYGIMNITGGTLRATSDFSFAVQSGGRFWSNQNQINITGMVVYGSAQATFAATPFVRSLVVLEGGAVTATAPLNLVAVDLSGTLTGSALVSAQASLRSGATIAGTLTVAGNVTCDRILSSAALRLTLQSQSFLQVNFGVDRLNIQAVDFASATLDLTTTTNFPTVSGTTWTFVTFTSYTGALKPTVLLPAGTTDLYSIIYEPAGGPFTSAAVRMTSAPPTTTPPVVPVPVMPPVAPTPFMSPVAVAAPSGSPVPVAAPSGSPVPIAAPSGSPVPVAAPSGSPVAVAAPVNPDAPVAAPVAPAPSVQASPVAEPVAPAPVAPVPRTLSIGVSSVLNSTQQNDLKSALASTLGTNTGNIILSGSGIGNKRSNFVVVATFSGPASTAFDAYFTGNLTQKTVALSTAVQSVPSLASVVDSISGPTPPPVAAPVAMNAPTASGSAPVVGSPQAVAVSASAQITAGFLMLFLSSLLAVL